ncbi:hypothetical protein V8F06_002825 [Rhypophila decipiens]
MASPVVYKLFRPLMQLSPFQLGHTTPSPYPNSPANFPFLYQGNHFALPRPSLPNIQRHHFNRDLILLGRTALLVRHWSNHPNASSFKVGKPQPILPPQTCLAQAPGRIVLIANAPGHTVTASNMSRRSHQEAFPPTAEDASKRQEIEIPSEEPSEPTQAFAADDETWELKDYPSIWQLDDCPDLVFPCARRYVPMPIDWRNALLERRRNYDEKFLWFGTGRCFLIKHLFAAVTAPRSTAKSAKHAREGMLRGPVALDPQLYPRDLVDLLKIRYKRGVRTLQSQNPNATAPETYMHNQDVDQEEGDQAGEESMAEAQDENGDIIIPDVPEPMDDLHESDYS